MATKKLILQFTGQPSAGSAFVYDIYISGSKLSYLNGLNTINLNYKVGANVIPNQIGIGATLSDTINNTVSFLTANYSANSTAGGFVTTMSYLRVGNNIEITVNSSASDNLIMFFKIFSSNVFLRFITDVPCQYAYITNQSIGDAKLITLNGLPSDFYYIKNNTLNTQLSTFLPGSLDTRLTRGYNYSIIKASDMSVKLTFDIPASTTNANMNIYFSNNDLYVNVISADPILTFLYSLDGITYQSSNIFPALAVGNYTVYVKDNLGCEKTYPITNTGTTNGNFVDAYTDVSESNSIRFAKQVVWGNCGDYKNVFNTLSCQEDDRFVKPTKFTQLFQACDNAITTQVKTSYENVEVGADTTQITATKIVRNIAVSDKRDCTYLTYNGQLAVLFTTGNIYDYGTTNVIGTYELNGSLPEFGVIGTWVETAYGTLQISNIAITDNGDRLLTFGLNITIIGTIAGTIQTIYNRDSFDIWEFTIDMSLFLDMQFNVGIKFSQTVPDVNFPDVFWKSERIWVKTRWPRSKEIIWRNTENTDIYFFSGIEMKNRLNFCDINTNLSDGDVETQKTDSQVISIDATNYNAVEFEANFLTTGMMRKVKLALKHNYLVIEGVPYTLAENPETERQGKSNLYNLKAKLFEAGDAWNQIGTQTVLPTTPLIGLLQGDLDAQYIRTQ